MGGILLTLYEIPYDRAGAVRYANRWAYFRNPEFYDFSKLGGDCTSFASQCLLAGGGVMNFTPTFGWYYVSLGDRAPAWTGVKYLYNFLVNNTGIGPYGHDAELSEVEPGDLVQLVLDEEDWQHTPVVVGIESDEISYDSVWVAAHSHDCNCRPLSSYPIRSARFIHIDGIRSFCPEGSGEHCGFEK